MMVALGFKNLKVAGRDAWIKPTQKNEKVSEGLTHEKRDNEIDKQNQLPEHKSRKREVKAEHKKMESNDDFKKLLGF